MTLDQLSQMKEEGRAVAPRGIVRFAVGEDSRVPFAVKVSVKA